MGRSEYGIRIKNDADWNEVIELVEVHNNGPEEEMGETLELYAVLQHKGKYYAIMGNGGGRSFTSAFMTKWTDLKIYHPFEKPDWWMDCEDYFYQRKAGEALPDQIFGN